MRRTRPCRHRRAGGFTLIEAVLVIVMTGALFATVAHFIVPPVQAYLATTARAQLVDQADLALRRIGRDLRIALPNSTRVSASGLALELIPTTAGARYVAEGTNRLVFGSLVERWNTFSPVPLSPDMRRFGEEVMAISQYNLRSVPVTQKNQALRIGGLGEVTYRAMSSDRYWLGVMHMLADFAQFSGVGVQTATGMGQVRRMR